MANKRLDQFKGKLVAAQIADGMNAAAANARRLAEDAALLLGHDRWASAASLAILSIEESGKTSILRRLATAIDDTEIKDIWREYRSHTKKNVMAVFMDLFQQGARKLSDFGPVFDSDSDHPLLFDQVKQLGFYSDCLGNAHWAEPATVIEPSLAKAMVATAQVLASSRTTTADEIEIWIQHVGPHLRGSQAAAERALEQWYTEMQKRGLADEGDNAMSQFIKEGVGRA